MGISNMSATIPGFVVPAFVGFLTHGQVGNIIKLKQFQILILTQVKTIFKSSNQSYIMKSRFY